MEKEDLKQVIMEVIKEMQLSSLEVPFHTHTQTDAGQLDASKSLIHSPQSTIAAVAGTPSTGGTAPLEAADSAIIVALITAVNSLISTNKIIGFTKLS